MLTQEYLKSILHYDPLTGIFTRTVSVSQATRPGDIAGSTHRFVSKYYREIKIAGCSYKAHRLAFLYMAGSLPKEQVDHIDGNGLNNKWSNLRQASRQDNAKNHRLRCTNKSGYIGIDWNKAINKWHARIVVDGYRKHLGYFKNKEDAIIARKEASIKYGYHPNHGQVRPL